METLKAIGLRTSLKTRISAKDIEPEKVRQVLNAGRLAPSAHNGQPWCFVVVNDRETVRKLVDNTFNQEVNRAARNAPVIIVVVANPDEGRVIHNREYYSFDIGLAVENMLLAATDLGLVTHLMSNVKSEGALKSSWVSLMSSSSWW
jgi:nitroreductase